MTQKQGLIEKEPKRNQALEPMNEPSQGVIDLTGEPSPQLEESPYTNENPNFVDLTVDSALSFTEYLNADQMPNLFGEDADLQPCCSADDCQFKRWEGNTQLTAEQPEMFPTFNSGQVYGSQEARPWTLGSQQSVTTPQFALNDAQYGFQMMPPPSEEPSTMQSWPSQYSHIQYPAGQSLQMVQQYQQLVYPQMQQQVGQYPQIQSQPSQYPQLQQQQPQLGQYSQMQQPSGQSFQMLQQQQEYLQMQQLQPRQYSQMLQQPGQYSQTQRPQYSQMQQHQEEQSEPHQLSVRYSQMPPTADNRQYPINNKCFSQTSSLSGQQLAMVALAGQGNRTMHHLPIGNDKNAYRRSMPDGPSGQLSKQPLSGNATVGSLETKVTAFGEQRQRWNTFLNTEHPTLVMPLRTRNMPTVSSNALVTSLNPGQKRAAAVQSSSSAKLQQAKFKKPKDVASASNTSGGSEPAKVLSSNRHESRRLPIRKPEATEAIADTQSLRRKSAIDASDNPEHVKLLQNTQVTSDTTPETTLGQPVSLGSPVSSHANDVGAPQSSITHEEQSSPTPARRGRVCSFKDLNETETYLGVYLYLHGISENTIGRALSLYRYDSKLYTDKMENIVTARLQTFWHEELPLLSQIDSLAAKIADAVFEGGWTWFLQHAKDWDETLHHPTGAKVSFQRAKQNKALFDYTFKHGPTTKKHTELANAAVERQKAMLKEHGYASDNLEELRNWISLRLKETKSAMKISTA